MRELMNVRTTRKENGRERMGADGYGEHDDLVIALASWRGDEYDTVLHAHCRL
jgi:hypothetical protein